MSTGPSEARETGLRLNRLGGVVTAIATGGKGPRYPWQRSTEQRQTTSRLLGLPWNGRKAFGDRQAIPPAGRAGVISGPNNWRVLDVDALAGTPRPPVPENIRDAILDGLGLSHDYPWARRSTSGAGWHIWIRCTENLPTGKGVLIGDAAVEHFSDFNKLELRWSDCQTVFAGTADNVPAEPPAMVEIEAVLRVFEQLTSRSERPKRLHSTLAPAEGGRMFSLGEDIAQAAKNLARLSSSRADDYNSWLAVGMALTPLGPAGLVLWDNWSRSSAKYQEGEAEAKWRGFETDPHGLAKLGSWANADSPEATVIPSIRRVRPRPSPATSDDAPAAEVAEPQPTAEVEDAPTDSGSAANRPFVQPNTVLDSDLMRALDREEAGDAELLTMLFRDKVVFDLSDSAWYRFSKHRWERCAVEPRSLVWGPLAASYLALAARLRAATKTKSDATIDALIQRAQRLRSLRRINNVMTLAQELLGISGSEWDSDPWLLGVENGVLDLRTGTLRNGVPSDFIRTAAPTTWRSLQEPAPRWDQFVDEILNSEIDRVTFLQRLLGYAMNGSTKEHVLAVCVGERGRNGKRVLFELLQHVLGDYTKSVSTDVLVGQDRFRAAGSAQPHLVELQGCRVAYASETGEHDQLSAAQVKNITGGDPITARKLHANPITFAPTHTLFLQTNRKPAAPPDDDALWSRIVVLEFKTRFVDQPTALDERRRDPLLEETLRAEASGILAWLVRGHLLWQQHGLQPPASVSVARDRYRLGESIDPFIEAACVEASGMSAEAAELLGAYQGWAQANGLTPKSATWLGRQLAARFQKGRTTSGRICYHGVGLVITDWPNPSDSSGNSTNPSERVLMPETPPADDTPRRVEVDSQVFLHVTPHDGKNQESASTLQYEPGETSLFGISTPSEGFEGDLSNPSDTDVDRALLWIDSLTPSARTRLASRVHEPNRLAYSIPDDLPVAAVVEAHRRLSCPNV